MSDPLVYEKSEEKNREEEKVPFLKKEMVFVDDQSQRYYNSSQVTIETTTLSDNGRWCDYSQGNLSIPLVITVAGVTNGTTDVIDFTAAQLKQADLLMCLKNSNLNLIDSIVVDYGNNNVIQQSARINNYLNFKLHSEMSYDDELLNGPTIGYSKDSPTSWQYHPTVSTSGTGICNNMNTTTESGSQEMRGYGNFGMRTRQDVFQKIEQS